MIQIYDQYDEEYTGNNDEKIYMSMRDHNGQNGTQYLDHLGIGDSGMKRRKRLEHEKERIAEVRRKFWANPTKTDIIRKHETYQQAWKDEARTKQNEYLKDLDARKKEYQARSQSSGEATRKRMLFFENEERILNLIPKWPKDSPSSHTHDSETIHIPSDEVSYGLKACIMHFKKGSGGHTHKYSHDEVKGEFPDQKILIEELLKGTSNNPLREPCKPDQFRYFHLPTNNMAWIEVSL